MSVGFQDYFRVRMAEEMGASGFKLTADFPEIVDFPIEGNSQRATRVVHGLSAAGKVDNGKPAVTEADAV